MEIHIPKTYHFEDFNIDQVNELNVGRKGLSLFQMHHSDVPVPDFFVISPLVFSNYIEKVFKDKGEELLNKGIKLEYRDIHAAFMKKDFEKELKEEIHKQYTKLSGFSDAWVSVRSSVCYPNNHNVSFSGVFSTKLNVRGIEHMLSAVKEIYAEYFSDQAIRYCVNEGVEISEVKLAVVVQKMIQPEVSGIAFTTDPITQNNSRMSVEAVYGLGDVISLGELTPDMYALDKKNLTILEKHIAPQEWMKIRTVGSNKLENSEKIQISPAWSH
ncbi:MAG TPA: PEP/pyruvate-binding domain-containing protein, partial [Candidatus Dojkabacteria bacterium]|nr:PEP/pyruvate-binding domain-containing protein [Candidatus Dojkabacteria bacterium]